MSQKNSAPLAKTIKIKSRTRVAIKDIANIEARDCHADRSRAYQAPAGTDEGITSAISHEGPLLQILRKRKLRENCEFIHGG